MSTKPREQPCMYNMEWGELMYCMHGIFIVRLLPSDSILDLPHETDETELQ